VLECVYWYFIHTGLCVYRGDLKLLRCVGGILLALIEGVGILITRYSADQFKMGLFNILLVIFSISRLLHTPEILCLVTVGHHAKFSSCSYNSWSIETRCIKICCGGALGHDTGLGLPPRTLVLMCWCFCSNVTPSHIVCKFCGPLPKAFSFGASTLILTYTENFIEICRQFLKLSCVQMNGGYK